MAPALRGSLYRDGFRRVRRRGECLGRVRRPRHLQGGQERICPPETHRAAHSKGAAGKNPAAGQAIADRIMKKLLLLLVLICLPAWANAPPTPEHWQTPADWSQRTRERY